MHSSNVRAVFDPEPPCTSVRFQESQLRATFSAFELIVRKMAAIGRARRKHSDGHRVQTHHPTSRCQNSQFFNGRMPHLSRDRKTGGVE